MKDKLTSWALLCSNVLQCYYELQCSIVQIFTHSQLNLTVTSPFCVQEFILALEIA